MTLLFVLTVLTVTAVALGSRTTGMSLARLEKVPRGAAKWNVHLAGMLVAVTVWVLVSHLRGAGPTRVPSPPAVLFAFTDMVRSGALARSVVASGVRIIVGFSLASIVGVSIGWLAGTFTLARWSILPVNSFFRYIPPIAFVSLMIVYLGIGEKYKVSVVFISVLFFIVQMVVDAVDSIDRRYFEMAVTCGMSPFQVFRYVVVPATLPYVVDILRVNLSGAWTFLVAAEIVGSDGGLGHLIAVSQRFGRIEELYVAILSFGVIGVASDWIIRVSFLRAFRWR